MAEKLFTLRLTSKEVWYLHEAFEASFTDPDCRNEHEQIVSRKLNDLLHRTRRDGPVLREVCDV